MPLAWKVRGWEVSFAATEALVAISGRAVRAGKNEHGEKGGGGFPVELHLLVNFCTKKCDAQGRRGGSNGVLIWRASVE